MVQIAMCPYAKMIKAHMGASECVLKPKNCWQAVLPADLPCCIRQIYGTSLNRAFESGHCAGIWSKRDLYGRQSPLFVALITNDDLFVEIICLNSRKFFYFGSPDIQDLKNLVVAIVPKAKAFQWFVVASCQQSLQAIKQNVVSTTIATMAKKSWILHYPDISLHDAHEVFPASRYELDEVTWALIDAFRESRDGPEWEHASIGIKAMISTESRCWIMGSFPRPRAILVFNCTASHCRIEAIGTLPEFRRQGLATALLQAAANTLLSEGWGHWEVRVDWGNVPAVKLFQKTGFSLRNSRIANLRLIF